MNKRLKWGLTAVVLAGAAALGAYSMLPQENEELAAAEVIVGFPPVPRLHAATNLKWLQIPWSGADG